MYLVWQDLRLFRGRFLFSRFLEIHILHQQIQMLIATVQQDLQFDEDEDPFTIQGEEEDGDEEIEIDLDLDMDFELGDSNRDM